MARGLGRQKRAVATCKGEQGLSLGFSFQGPGDSPDSSGERFGPPEEGGGHLQGEQDEDGQADGSVGVFHVGLLDAAHGHRHPRPRHPRQVAGHLRK